MMPAIKMKEEYFTLNRSYPISCKRYLPDDLPIHTAVLGVHGFAGDKESSMLRFLAEDLTRKNAALISFDFPGHGNSPLSGDFLTIENCVSDLKFMIRYCMEQFPLAEHCLFATSFGGFIALLSNETLLLNHYRAVLRAPAVNMPELFLPMIGLSKEEYRLRNRVNCGFPGEREILVPFAFYEELQNYDLSALDYLPMHYLVIHGEKDDLVPYAAVRQFCETINNRDREHPCFDLHALPSADHRFKGPGEMDEIVRTAEEYWKIS